MTPFLLPASSYFELIDWQHSVFLLSRGSIFQRRPGFLPSLHSGELPKIFSGYYCVPGSASSYAVSLRLHSLHVSHGLHRRFFPKSSWQRVKIAFSFSRFAPSS